MSAVTPGPPEQPIRVLLADDDPLVRSSLVMLLDREADISVVAEAGNGADVLALVPRHRPHVVVMDIRMPVMDGLAATEAVRALPDPPEVVMLTTFNADEQVIRAVRAGAAGFILKDTHPADIVAAVRRVSKGDPILSPKVTRQLMAHVTGSDAGQRREHARSLLGLLHPREHATAVAIGRGKSNAEIADELSVSVATVKTHVSRVLSRLELNNRVQVAILVHEAGLLDTSTPEPS